MKTITRLILRRVAGGRDAFVAKSEGDASSPGPVSRLNGLPVGSHDGGVAPTFCDGASQPPNCLRRAIPAAAPRLTFVSPLPGRWIRRTGCVASLAFLLATGLAHAASDASAMDAANRAFAQGRYAEAAHGCETIITQQGYSAPVLFNLANAQQRDGKFGSAIPNYERAALLSPNDPGIVANLKIARQKAGVEAGPQSLLHKAAQALTMNTWFGLASVALFLFAITWPLKLLRPQMCRALKIGSVTAAVTLALAVGALGFRGGDLRRAVVVAPEAVAGVSPVTLAEPVFKLRAGEIVMVQNSHGDFALVRNCAGHEGWVKTDEIERVIPVSTTFASR